MAVSDNAATFLGINNENEFYSAHYLAEVFKGDINEVLGQWQAKADADDNYQTPQRRLRNLAREYFSMRERSQKERNKAKATAMQRDFFKSLLTTLDIPWQPENVVVGNDQELPVLARIPNQTSQPAKLWVLGALDPGKEGLDPLSLQLSKAQYVGEGPHADSLKNSTWYDLLNNVVFKQDDPPRWVLLLSDRQCVLIDRYKWLQNRMLRFDWDEILGRKDDHTLKASAALLHSDSLVPEQGASLLDSLDENSHKHAFGVSEDLKYALREAIELLGNEAVEQLIQQSGINYTGQNALDPEKVSRECLRYMYRMLFLFYIEARPELNYVPMDSDAWRKGYSLESLRDLELVKLTSEESRQGFYLHHSINKMFTLIHQGYDGSDQQQGSLEQAWEERSIHNSFKLEKLDSHLFDPKLTPYLNKVKFSNATLQTIIRLMSLTRETSGRGRKRRGRVSYAQLGINQLGSVYEALLSYRGFFASEDLYEVKKSGEKYNELETGYFVPEAEINDYKEDEKVFIKDENNHLALKVHKRGRFIYRLAGRDREKSASYYTPEVLTKCLVKYTLKERLEGLNADDILELTVCEPAMGSAAFLNEGVNQLSEAYLTRKQHELNERIPHEDYREELQKVKIRLADSHVFGVDLNPIAVELAEVSLWLNALSQSNQVPWFGYQLFSGNSLIGARRQVYRPDQLTTRVKEDRWYTCKPKRLNPESLKSDSDRDPKHIFHFLLPDEGMAGVSDKEARKLLPDTFAHIKEWKSQFLKPFSLDEIKLLQGMSAAVDALWKEHADTLRADRKRTEDRFPIWGQPGRERYHTSTDDKDNIRRTGIFNNNAKTASAYRRLKLVMDYWCALWFWPLEQAELLPDRASWLFELNLILQGQVYSFQPEQGSIFEVVGKATTGFEKPVEDLFAADEPQLNLTPHEQAAQSVKTASGELNLEKLFKQFPRLNLVNKLGDKFRFFHWELTFADVFADKGGFDVMLGNPPWLKVEFDEIGVLGETNPKFAFEKFSPTVLREKRSAEFDKSPELERVWFSELTQAEGVQSLFSSKQIYPLLNGQKANLYKAFITLSWDMVNDNAFIGLLHQEGFYDAKRGERAREAVYKRLVSHFQFYNEKELFSAKDVHHSTSFSLNIYRKYEAEVSFVNIANLFSVKALGECLDKTNDQALEGVRDQSGNWSVKGSPERVVVVDYDVLKIFRDVFDAESETTLGARLASIHAVPMLSTIRKISEKGGRLESLTTELQIGQLFDENVYQKNGLISKKPGLRGDELVVLSGPNTSLANSFYKFPRYKYRLSSDYDVVDLLQMTFRENRKTVFKVNDSAELLRNVPFLKWEDKLRLTDVVRVAFSEWVSDSAERTLSPCLLGENEAHLDTIVSVAMRDLSLAVGFLGLSCSLPVDFLVRSTGVSHIKSWLINKLPYIDSSSKYYQPIAVRALSLNCLTSKTDSLWGFVNTSEDEGWASNSPILISKNFSEGTSKYSDRVLRSYFERRQALIELDVLSSLYFGLKYQELLSLYKVQFSVLIKYENDTWYDSLGNIIFTCNVQGLKGVGLPRKVRKNTNTVTVEYHNGREETKSIGWEDIAPHLIETESGRVEQRQRLPAGTKVHHTVIDDTLPGGPREKIITYVAPFYLPNREEDYRVAWEVFSERFKDE